MHLRHIILLLLLCSHTVLFGQTFSYVYIQGDKETPFYVKMEDEMLPRYGKNYCIISELDPGPIHLEVLFQQNKYPAQKFTVQVPEAGQRTFLLTKKDSEFYLYDLRQQFYLSAGNTEADDRLPSKQTVAMTSNTSAASREIVTEEEPIRTKPRAIRATPAPVEPKEKKKPIFLSKNPDEGGTPAKPANNSGEPQFLGDMQLSNGNQQPAESASRRDRNNGIDRGDVAETTPASSDRENTTATRSGNCKTPMPTQAFGAFYKKVLEIESQESRLVWLMDPSDCISTDQARILARSLDGDAARYTYLKSVLSRTTDRNRAASLENLLDNEAYKKQFRELL